MITLETLPGDAGTRQKRRRIGRGEGSGWGKTSGRGSKGAQSRSGYSSRPGFEGGQNPLRLRLPKRGFNRKRFRTPSEIINTGDLDAIFESGATVNADTLAQRGLIDNPKARLKVLGDGELTKKLTIQASAFSAKARERIEAAGGACEVV